MEMINDPVTPTAPLCLFCKHYFELPENSTSDVSFVCRAFPYGIPDEIINNEVDHRNPIKGDGGIQFELIRGEKMPLDTIALLNDLD